MVAIIDYDAGNIKSVEKACSFLGEQALVTREESKILAADRVILPGVGSFGDAMENLARFGLPEVIQTVVKRQRPLLGICLGLQLFFEESEESPGVRGLSLLEGKVVRLPEGDGRKIPQIGWNQIRMEQEGSRLFRNIPDQSFVYFVHSFCLQAAHPEDVAASCDYGLRFHAAVEHGNLFACQFHPEKSGELGLAILKNFLEVPVC